MKFIDRLPTRPGRVKITLEDGSSYFATMERADDPTVEGTPLNAENLNRLASKSGAFEDGTTAHTKPVPADAAPYAEVVEIGGMTYKDGDTLRSAPVTEVESVGVNLAGEPSYLGNVTYDNGVYKQINADTITGQLSFKYLKFKGTSNYVDLIGTRVVYTSGNLLQEFTKDEGFDNLFFGFNGKNVDTLCGIDVSHLTNGKTYCLSVNITNLTQGSLSWCDVMLNEGTTALPYTPYTRNTLPIPEAVRNLDGYGWGIDATYRNYVDFDKKQFVKWVERKVFDGTERWIDEGVKGTDTYYTLSKIGDMNSIVDIVSICNKYDTVLFSSGNKLIGCFVANSTGYNQAQINIRPESASSMSTEKMKEMCAEWYAQGDPLTVYYALATPIITDISDLLPADNIIGVEGGGTVTMVNEYGYDVPNTITFYEGKNEVVGADTFVGNLQGTAKRAEVAMDVPDWAKQSSKPKYTAEEVGARPNTWTPTPAEIGAAPAGFGLGGGGFGIDFSQVDTVKSNGWYAFVCPNTTINNITFHYAYMLAEVWDINNCRQTLYPVHHEFPVLIRNFYAGIWNPWEVENPPMQLGVEYRTTERMNGKAVYKKLDSSGKLLMRLDGETEWKDYVYNATNAINAVNDGEGNNIATTYMTKSEAAILGRVATGTYVGREDLAQTVTIGFKPKFITAIRQINKDRFFYIAGDGTGTFHETDTGFTTGYSTEEYRHPTNYAGETYTYFAIG